HKQNKLSRLGPHDGFDAAPSTLRMGDLVIQRHVLPWPTFLTSPIGSLRLGLYTRENGNRLLARPAAGDGEAFLELPLPAIAAEAHPGG
ncbi:MAG: hypothetical protein ACK2UK_01705, partial [Candidatus Promineifilaceae bacterium]